jgi:hypothetical protein
MTNDHKINLLFPFLGLQKHAQNGIFGMQIYHLATLVGQHVLITTLDDSYLFFALVRNSFIVKLTYSGL